MKFATIPLAIVVALLAASSNIVSASVYTECTQNGLVALTFDEGPSKNIPSLLASLREGKAKATFHFVARYLTDSHMRNLASQVRNEGHEIGLRTDPKWNLSALKPDAIQKLIVNSAKVFEKSSGCKVTYVRVPFDMNDSSVIAAIEGAGYLVTKPNLDSQDYGGASIDAIVNTFDLAFTAAPEGSASFITVQRDAVDNSVAAVGQIIASGRENGYDFVTLSTCIGKSKGAGSNGGGGAKGNDDVVVVRRGGKHGKKNDISKKSNKKKKAHDNHESGDFALKTISIGFSMAICLFSMFLMN